MIANLDDYIIGHWYICIAIPLNADISEQQHIYIPIYAVNDKFEWRSIWIMNGCHNCRLE